LNYCRQLRQSRSAVAASAWLLASGAAWGIVRPHHVGHQRVDAARLLSLGAEDALAKVTVLGLCQGEFGVNRGKLLTQLGHLAVVTLLQPRQALHGPCMQGAILTRLELQLDVFAAADADEFKVEGLRGGALARRG
jgi:hypothetical protein